MDMNMSPPNVINIDAPNTAEKITTANSSPLNMLLNIGSVNSYNMIPSPLYGNLEIQDQQASKTLNSSRLGTDNSYSESGSVHNVSPLSGGGKNESPKTDKVSSTASKPFEMVEEIKGKEQLRKEENSIGGVAQKSSDELVYSTEMIKMLLGGAADVSPSSALHLDQIANGAFQDHHEEHIGKNTLSLHGSSRA
ncbi:hypothetical protein PMKS-001008 [Pichia membranifaciens]|uniref:Uncharacterized protein n=1 Tax=Pichia membranifaciens TaxID=4926 RepID=A0A1Q2YDC1_9ASCO|nr:hypothetical protein PMKS-001008 [Pichia membranifaciens]